MESGLPGDPWEHVSVSVANATRKLERCPTWEEMAFVKDSWWEAEEAVVQFHPPRSEYVNCHPFSLHLWKPPYALALPPSITVGPRP